MFLLRLKNKTSIFIVVVTSSKQEQMKLWYSYSEKVMSNRQFFFHAFFMSPAKTVVSHIIQNLFDRFEYYFSFFFLFMWSEYVWYLRKYELKKKKSRRSGKSEKRPFTQWMPPNWIKFLNEHYWREISLTILYVYGINLRVYWQ